MFIMFICQLWFLESPLYRSFWHDGSMVIFFLPRYKYWPGGLPWFHSAAKRGSIDLEPFQSTDPQGHVIELEWFRSFISKYTSWFPKIWAMFQTFQHRGDMGGPLLWRTLALNATRPMTGNFGHFKVYAPDHEAGLKDTTGWPEG
jgi:hypothetical protein